MFLTNFVNSVDRNLLLQNGFVTAVVLLVLLCVWIGFRSGKALSQSKLIMANANTLSVGLNYFHSDYDRFPSLLEYQTPNLMAVYFSKWPPMEFDGKLCDGSFEYESSRYNEYVLSVCLPKAKDGGQKGLNRFTVTK